MKVFGFFAALLMSQAALAYPAVGDYVKFTGTLTLQSSTAIPVVLEVELLSFDAPTKVYTMRSTTDIAGQVSVQESLAGEADLFPQAMIQSILSSCAQEGGTPSRTTVPAGSFDVCVIPQTDGKSSTTYSIGDVPFGVVKSETVSAVGTRTVLTLETVRFGK